MSYNGLTCAPPVSQMIRFGDCFFSCPEVMVDLGLLAALDNPGLYVVMAYDPAWRPLPYRPLYVGESDRIWGRATSSHENYANWCREAGGRVLYRSFHYMPGSTQRQRQFAESALIVAYNPACNRKVSLDFTALLAGRT